MSYLGDVDLLQKEIDKTLNFRKKLSRYNKNNYCEESYDDSISVIELDENEINYSVTSKNYI